MARLYVLKAAKENLRLDEVIPEAECDAVLKEATIRVATHGTEEEEDEAEEAAQSVAVTSYEGSKSRSAQYVFLIGAHSGELPRNAAAIRDIEICKFLVGLTRTKSKCAILSAKNSFGEFKNNSEFLSWISATKFQIKKINKHYWTR